MSVVIAICIIIVCIYWLIQKKNKPQLKPLPNLTLKPVSSHQQSPKYLQILKLVNSDKSIADRLIQHTEKNHPTKSKQWILEKVLSDLERDRA